MVMILVRDKICDNIYCPTKAVLNMPAAFSHGLVFVVNYDLVVIMQLS
jgi:hypothetical protein